MDFRHVCYEEIFHGVRHQYDTSNLGHGIQYFAACCCSIDIFGNVFSSIWQCGKFSGFLIAQPDLANGTRFQVQMKTRLTVFHLHLESRAVRKIRLRYRESHQFIPLLSQHDFRVIGLEQLN